MALNKVEICGVNTSRLPVLKPEEKKELFQKIKKVSTIVKQSMDGIAMILDLLFLNTIMMVN